MELQKTEYMALKLCTVLLGIFSLQTFTGFEPAFQAGVSPWWKFFVSFFGHSGPEHLFNNLFFIALFGTLYEAYTSSRIFWSTFLISAIGANLTAFIFYTGSAIIGASGGAMGLLSALAVYKPRKIGLVLGIPAPMYMVLIGYLIINFAGITGSSSVAYEAHLFGLFTGSIFGLWLRDSSKKRKKKENEHEKNKGSVDEGEYWSERIRNWEEKYMM